MDAAGAHRATIVRADGSADDAGARRRATGTVTDRCAPTIVAGRRSEAARMTVVDRPADAWTCGARGDVHKEVLTVDVLRRLCPPTG